MYISIAYMINAIYYIIKYNGTHIAKIIRNLLEGWHLVLNMYKQQKMDSDFFSLQKIAVSVHYSNFFLLFQKFLTLDC